MSRESTQDRLDNLEDDVLALAARLDKILDFIAIQTELNSEATTAFGALNKRADFQHAGIEALVTAAAVLVLHLAQVADGDPGENCERILAGLSKIRQADGEKDGFRGAMKMLAECAREIYEQEARRRATP